MKLSYTESIPSWLHTRANELISRRVDLANGYIHVTQLLQPAHMVTLQHQHWSELTQSPDDLIPALIGTAWHRYLEGSMQGGYAERRIEMQHQEWTIIGTPDWFSREVLVDFKTTKCWSKVFGKREWEEQVNVYRWLIYEALGIKIPRLEIHAVYLDWSENAAMRNEDFPRKRWEVIEVPVWGMEDARNFVEARLARLEDQIIERDVCTPEERWERGECYAVMKYGRKSAMPGGIWKTEVYTNAEALAKEMSEGITQGYVEHRPGKPVRCQSWCSVKDFCEFGRAL